MSPRPRLVLLLVLFAAISLLWFPYQSSSYYPKPAPTPLENDTPPPIDDSPNTHPIITNNITFPRINPGAISPSQARLFINRIRDVKSDIFQPAHHPVGQQNHWHLDRLVEYLSKAETHGNYPPPVVVMTSWHWMPCAYGPCTTGEVQWIRPLIEIMKEHGIFFLFSPYEGPFKKEVAMLGSDLITHFWADDEHLLWCFADRKHCIQSDQNPDGIPLWKLFAFTFWGSKPNMLKWKSPNRPWSFNPLGPEWNLVPYPMPDNQFYLGYHYQGCQALPYVPHEQRKNQIVILAKLSNYFHLWPAYDPKTFYVQLKEALGDDFELLSNADEEENYPIPLGITSLGLLPPKQYDLQLSGAKALLGIGKPIISPTPYASLCRGVPVILPYRSKYYEKSCTARPSSLTEYCGFDEDVHQHGPATEIGEPYVYTVDVSGPIEPIIETIKRAVSTPIQPFEPEEMKRKAVQKRLLDYFSIDWKAYSSSRSGKLEEFLIEWTQSNPDPNPAL